MSKSDLLLTYLQIGGKKEEFRCYIEVCSITWSQSTTCRILLESIWFWLAKCMVANRSITQLLPLSVYFNRNHAASCTVVHLCFVLKANVSMLKGLSDMFVGRSMVEYTHLSEVRFGGLCSVVSKTDNPTFTTTSCNDWPANRRWESYPSFNLSLANFLHSW